ncbi:hypothetical protein BDN72DRAFT_629475 [Pluteus cervinus]|uniref:Uncharacterized protein n=1 Tax=Pluteus cervinus TaxID=181527 RepID=A0ACD3B9Z5_9AGAR|nr:hypothetical protein BDN72DRAFT_629475 [Pluteus cervinus]
MSPLRARNGNGRDTDRYRARMTPRRPLYSHPLQQQQPRQSRILPHLPPELYWSIIDFVTDTQDLCNLTLTSRICQNAAEHILYRTIDLGRDTLRLESWAGVILDYPDKAAHVQALSVTFDTPLLIVPCMVRPTLQLLSQALRVLPNLRSLTLLGHPMVMMNPLNSWILQGCDFKLQTFHNEVFPASALHSFLSTQPTIREWRQADLLAEDSMVLASTLGNLPELMVFRGHAALFAGIDETRPLRRVSLRMDGVLDGFIDRELLRSLALCGSTILALHLEQSGGHLYHGQLLSPRSSAILKLLRKSVPYLPNLRLLVIGESNNLKLSIQDYISIINQYPSLQGIIFKSNNKTGVQVPNSILGCIMSQCPRVLSVATLSATGQGLLAFNRTKTEDWGGITQAYVHNASDVIDNLRPWWI